MKYMSMAAFAFLAAMLTGCTNDDLVQSENDGRVITITTTVNIGGSDTRALTEDGVKTFEVGDKVGLVYEISGSGPMAYVTSQELTAADISSDKKSAKLTFTLTNPKASGYFEMHYPITNLDDKGYPKMYSYAIQDGTFANVQAIEYSEYVDNLTAGCQLPDKVDMENMSAIAKFTVQNANGQDITNTITNLTVRVTDTHGSSIYTVNRTAAAGPIYLAMAQSDDPVDVIVTATDGTETYQKSVTGKSIQRGKIYPITVVGINVTDRIDPLTFEAKEAGAVVKFKLSSNALGNVEYCTNGSTWLYYASEQEITLTNVGDKVMFRGNNATYTTSNTERSNFSCSDDCYVYGNVMSLIHPTGYATLTTLPADSTFYGLFRSNEHIVNHATKPLVLPATTLTKGCYGYMFIGCKGLTKAPILPATTLTEECYKQMFTSCSLTEAPVLPATTLAPLCYDAMFVSCPLTEAPVLPATTLAVNCYSAMFWNCKSLQTAPVLPVTTLEFGCYQSMFKGCTSLQTAPALPATTLADYCYANMFQECTSLTTAPDLPAETLVDYCYSYMFSGCTQLNSVKCMATDISAHYCTANWLSNVASTGTVTAASAGIWARNSTSGIPTGWNVVQTANTNSTLIDYTIENTLDW